MSNKTIREAEAQSHIQMYSENELFTGSTWLSKPVKTVIELLPLLDSKGNITVLDLGCGVGRNCIPVAQRFAEKHCRIECVDILPEAISILSENAKKYNVESAIEGVVCPIDDYTIHPGRYDLIIAVSALEHMDSESSFYKKLIEMRNGLKSGGLICIIMNTEVLEQSITTGDSLEPQFEINIATQTLLDILHDTFRSHDIIKEAVCAQSYEVPRGNITVMLKSNVVTFTARRVE